MTLVKLLDFSEPIRPSEDRSLVAVMEIQGDRKAILTLVTCLEFRDVMLSEISRR